MIRVPKPLKRLQWKLRMLQWQVHRQFQDSVTLETKQGVFELPLAANEAVSRHLYVRREFELDWVESSLAFLRRRNLCPARGQGTVLDIGANNGVIAIGMLAANEFAHAVAIEPDPTNFAFLCGNVAANGLQDRVTCLNFAVSDRRSVLEFELSDDNFGDHRVRRCRPPADACELFNESGRDLIRVPADTVDHLLSGVAHEWAEPVALVWIDVQGYEGYVFQGATELLAGDIPVVAELWPYGIDRSGIGIDRYAEIAAGLWAAFWTERRGGFGRGRFNRHPISELPDYMAHLGRTARHANVIYTR